MTINENAQAVVEEFLMFDDWMDKYEFIIEIGKELPLIEEQCKIEDNLIKGCQSRVWVQADFKNDIIQIKDTKNNRNRQSFMTKKVKAMLKTRQRSGSGVEHIFQKKNGGSINHVYKVFDRTVEALGFNLTWFAILVAVNLQTAWLSPPVALSAYFLKGVVPQWDLKDIYLGMMQFMVIQVLGLILIIIFPQIALWLPSVMYPSP